MTAPASEIPAGCRPETQDRRASANRRRSPYGARLERCGNLIPVIREDVHHPPLEVGNAAAVLNRGGTGLMGYDQVDIAATRRRHPSALPQILEMTRRRLKTPGPSILKREPSRSPEGRHAASGFPASSAQDRTVAVGFERYRACRRPAAARRRRPPRHLEDDGRFGLSKSRRRSDVEETMSARRHLPHAKPRKTCPATRKERHVALTSKADPEAPSRGALDKAGGAGHRLLMTPQAPTMTSRSRGCQPALQATSASAEAGARLSSPATPRLTIENWLLSIRRFIMRRSISRNRPAVRLNCA